MTDSTTTTSINKLPTFQYPKVSPVTDAATKLPDHAEPVLYSQAVTQKPTTETTYPTEIFDARPTNPSSLSSQNHGQAMPRIPGNKSNDSKKACGSSFAPTNKNL